MTVRRLGLLLLLLATSRPDRAWAEPLTLDEALKEARLANASLPLAAVAVTVGQARLREARAERWLKLSVLADFRYAPPGATYNPANTVNEERLQVVGVQPLYEGGQLRAAIDAAQANLKSSEARYRIAEKDLDLAVRSGFATLVKIEAEIAFRRSGIAQLEDYLAGVRARERAGQGVLADVLKTEVRLADEQANVVDAERRRDAARIALDDLLGRDPASPVEPAAAPPPEPPTSMPATDEPWLRVPELVQAMADYRAAEAGVAAVRAERLPHLELTVDGGLLGEGLLHPSASALVPRLREDLGASAMISAYWNFFDFGVYRARLDSARLELHGARQSAVVLARTAHFGWAGAVTDLGHLYRELGVRAQAVPIARDAYLQAESLYRGGVGTSLEVLDAWAASIGAQEAYADAVLAYRIALATALRWSTP